MTETENANVDQEVVNPAVEEVSQAQDQAVGQEGNPGQEQVGQPENDKEYNFKQIRENNARLQAQLEQERREREQLQQMVEQKFADQLKPQAEEEVDELADVAEDDWLTRKHAEKLAERRAREIVKNMLAEENQKRAIQELPNRLKTEHADFESVVTKENVEYLKANKPHIAATLAATKDPYAQALAAYDAIKAFCPTAQMKEEEDRMAQNAQKPGTLGAAQAPSPLTEAKALERGLTPEMKAKYHKEMIAAMRGS